MKKLLFLLLLLSSTLHAEVTLHGLFGSGMVLQRETEVAIWGWAEPGETVSITCSWNNTPIALKADAKGDWSARLKTEKAAVTPSSKIRDRRNNE
jgi:sialate O-acetylesterase